MVEQIHHPFIRWFQPNRKISIVKIDQIFPNFRCFFLNMWNTTTIQFRFCRFFSTLVLEGAGTEGCPGTGLLGSMVIGSVGYNLLT